MKRVSVTDELCLTVMRIETEPLKGQFYTIVWRDGKEVMRTTVSRSRRKTLWEVTFSLREIADRIGDSS